MQGERLAARIENSAYRAVENLDLQLGQGITRMGGGDREPAAIAKNAAADARFKAFKDIPEDRFEGFLSVPLLSRGKLVA